jgi:dTMP kinase
MGVMPAQDDATIPARVRGVFLALDGPDGGGKTTQAARLAAWLRQEGHQVVACRDPGSTPLGDRLRAILLDRDAIPLTLRAEMLLFMASRAQLVEQVIRPALQEGRIVVSDRYLLANVVYQGYAGGLPVEEIWRVGQVATSGLMPDLTLLLDVPPEIARARIGTPRDRMEDHPNDYRRRVRAGFLQAAASYPAPLVVIDGSADPDTVAERLRNEVRRALALDSRS